MRGTFRLPWDGRSRESYALVEELMGPTELLCWIPPVGKSKQLGFLESSLHKQKKFCAHNRDTTFKAFITAQKVSTILESAQRSKVPGTIRKALLPVLLHKESAPLKAPRFKKIYTGIQTLKERHTTL